MKWAIRASHHVFVCFAMLFAFSLSSCSCGSRLVDGECRDGYNACQMHCVDFNTDVNHCGGCGHPCGAGFLCAHGACVASDGGIWMDGSLSDAGSDSGNVDANMSTDSGFRDAGPPRDAGPDFCGLGQLSCGGVCVNPKVDRQHCGDCDTVCTVGQYCANGSCSNVCDPPLSPCGSLCVNIDDDADNCGVCGRTCGSGICQSSNCVAASAGHIMMIGHDYVNSRTGMNKIVGNAVFFPFGTPVEVLAYQGDAQAQSITGTDAAINSVAVAIGRSWRKTVATAATVPFQLVDSDVLLIYAQRGATDMLLQDLGTMWEASLRDFLRRGGVVVSLETGGPNGGTYQILDAAGLFTAGGRIVITGSDVEVDPSAAGDFLLAGGVPSIYRGEATTVSFDSTETRVVFREVVTQDPVVIHKVIIP